MGSLPEKPPSAMTGWLVSRMMESASFELTTATRYFALPRCASRYLISAVSTLLLLPRPPPDCPLAPATGRLDASFANTGIADHTAEGSLHRTAEVSINARRATQSADARARALSRRRGTRRAANRIAAAIAQGMAI